MRDAVNGASSKNRTAVSKTQDLSAKLRMCTEAWKPGGLNYAPTSGETRLVFEAPRYAISRSRRGCTNCAVAPLAREGKSFRRQLARFCCFQKGILLCTDVAARGLDIPKVSA